MKLMNLSTSLFTCILFSSAAVDGLASAQQVIALPTNTSGHGIYYNASEHVARIAGAQLNGFGVETLPGVTTIDTDSGTVSEFVSLPYLPGGMRAGATRFSSNGRHVIGYSETTNTPVLSATQGVRWTRSENIVPVGLQLTSPLTNSSSAAHDVANNGNIAGISVIGGYQDSSGSLHLLSTQLPGFSGLGSAALSISDDSSTIAGILVDVTAMQTTAVVWSAVQNAAPHKLQDDFGIASAANVTSNDGLRIGGTIQSLAGVLAAEWSNLGQVNADGTYGTARFLAGPGGAALVGNVDELTMDGSSFGEGDFGSAAGPEVFIENPAFGPEAVRLTDYISIMGGSAPAAALTSIEQVFLERGVSYHTVVQAANGLYYYVEVPVVQ